MADLFENPMGLMGFEFVEFASPVAGVLEALFVQMGFRLVARHRSKDVELYRQGDINFIVNREPHSNAAYFAAEHGPCACSMAFRVKDSHQAYAMAIARGAQPVDIPTGPMELRLPAIKGIGGAPLYLINRGAEFSGNLREPMFGKVLKIAFYDSIFEARFFSKATQLNKKAVLEITGTDSDRMKGLNDFEDGN